MSVVYLYAAGAIGLLTSLFRDWYLITNTSNYKDVFAILYAASAASGFAINAITIGHGIENNKKPLIILTFVCTTYYLINIYNEIGIELLLTSMFIPMFWIYGSYASRKALEAGNIFLSKIRESITNILMVFLLLVGINLSFSIILSISVGTYFSYLLKYINTSKHKQEKQDIKIENTFFKYLEIVFYSSVAGLLINTWALNANFSDELVLNYAAPQVTRVSMYLFQFFSIPVILLTRYFVFKKSLMFYTYLLWSYILVFVIAMLLPFKFSSFIMPILATIILYLSVVVMHKKVSI